MELKLLKSTQDILDLVSEMTTKPFEFIHNPDLNTLAAVKMARQNMPSHYIYYKEKRAAVLDHLIAHECGHIYRMELVKISDRKVPASNLQNKHFALNQIEDDLEKMSQNFSVNQLSQLSNIWFDGIIRLVTNIPVDMRIETWIFNEYPELRKTQKKSIDLQMRDNIQVLSKRIESLTPDKIYYCNNVMNFAFAKFMESLIGKKYTTQYRHSKYADLGNKLADLVITTEDMGYKQDIEIIDKWTEMLDLQGWFYWTDFENLPADYLQN